MRIRYIRDWANGNTNGSNSNWNEIGAYDYNNTNIALNKAVTPSKNGSGNVSASVVTDGSDNAAFTFSGLGNVTIDLGGIYDIDRIRIRRYFPSGNSTTQYHETKTEVSIDGQDWITVFDCNVDGKYYETSEGKIINLKKEIDKLEENSSLEDVKDKVKEIENSLQATKDYFKNVLIDKDIECNEIDGMLDLINKVQDIKTGVNVTINDSVKVDYDFNLTLSSVSWVNASTIQRNFYNGSAVVLNNEIHILGGGGQSLKHHKYNGSSWSKVSDLPYNFQNGSAVVLNNEIHILGGTNSTYYKYHYKYDGASWTSVSTLPYDFYNGSAVIFNNEIHILGGTNNALKHYKWNGNSWTEVSKLPYNFQNGSAVVLNNEIHILGGDYNTTCYIKHYKYNGSSWSEVSTLPYSFYYGEAIVLNDEIHILGGNGGNNKYYKYNGSSWSNLASIPYYFTNGSAVGLNNEIHVLGSGYGSSYYTKHYKTKNYYELERL